MPSICLFCGSRAGSGTRYRRSAEDFGRLIAAEGWRLVYGAGDVGLMGTAARAAAEAGGAVFGVIPKHLVEMEVARSGLDALVVTETMHERKKVMFMNSDAAVALPGGLGTLDELFEVITWRQLGLHDKPVILVNTGNYWDPLTGLLDAVINEGFADASARALFTVVGSPVEAMRVLRSQFDRRSRSAE